MVVPAGIVSSGWPSAAQRLEDMGIEFDPWQVDLSRLVLGKNKAGKYAATVGGVVLSIPRQVGKTFTIGSLMFAICLLFPGTKILWTAHRRRTAEETFMAMQAMSNRKKVAPHMLAPVLGSGEEEIRFRNGSRILFGARERGFGLGMTNVDVLMFDEAQRLTEAAIDDMVPATNQARLPGGALIFFAGTPPRPTDPGEVFARKRRECLQGLVDDTLYVEFSADKGADPMDRKQWRTANPSYPHRTPTESMLRMIRQLGPESIPREMYGIWDDGEKRSGAIDLDRWLALKVKAGPPTRGQVTVDVAPDLDWTSVAVAAPGPDGRTLVLVDRFAGTDGAVEKVAGLVKNLTETVEVALTPTAALFSDKLTARKVEHKQLNTADLGRACSAFLVAVGSGAIAHVGQGKDLDPAIANAITRYVGDNLHWDRRDRVIDISPVVATSTAAHRWALLTAAPDEPQPPPRRVPSRRPKASAATAGF